MADNETCKFAEQLRRALERANWNVKGLNMAGFSGPIPSGVLVVICPDDKANPPGEALQMRRALQAAGIDANGITMKGTQPGTFNLLIGPKE